MEIDPYLYVLVAALIAGLVEYRRMERGPLRWFVPFLGLTVVIEGIGVAMVTWNMVDHWLFNLFTCAEFLFYSYFYYRVLYAPRWKKAIRIMLIVYPVLFLANLLLGEGFNRFHTITYRLGSIMAVLWSIAYFRQVMRSPGEISVLRDPVFWISTGLLFFYSGFFFYMSAGYILLYTKLKVDAFLWDVISNTLNILLYGCFIIAFLCQHSPKRRSLPL